ncbi:MAG: SGNH/GDSL hydrolase family protein [Roseburia sp.]|nr:SGNH/GDSL hydrolase family protein [Roseburia sp.]
MRRKKMLLMMAALLAAACTACGGKAEPDSVIIWETETEEPDSDSSMFPETAPTAEIESETSQPESTETEPETEAQTTQPETETAQTQETEAAETLDQLTEGEKAARREQQRNFDEARQLLYQLDDSKDKTMRINQMDRQILTNNTYDFSGKRVVFIGDSITEGITSAVDQNGNFVSYVTYVNSYLHFQHLLNHGVGGRMFSYYGGDELSLAANFYNVVNMDSDIIVVFAGVNDYLTRPEGKRFGNVDDKMSTSGYCGALRSFMNKLKDNCGDREIFFVTMYNVSKTAECTYSDYNGQPTLGDYMEAERQLVKEYGFHLIELYDTGFMDCSTREASDYFLSDGLHPKDNGNIVLGEHIAAELSLYFSQREQ